MNTISSSTALPQARLSPVSKFIFANQLRGIAAILVLISHWVGVFWGMREPVAAYTASPLQAGAAPALNVLLQSLFPLSFGPFGVSIFFLISGFVIPLSLEKVRIGQFLRARCFRIFPTYWVGLGIGLAAVALSGMYWGKPIFWNFSVLLPNLFFINNLLGVPSIDLVNWTLAIEIKFYLLAALMAAGLRKGKVLPIFAFSFLAFLFNWKLQNIMQSVGIPAVNIALSAVSTELFYIQFMFIGTFFCYAILDKITVPQLIVCSLVQVAFFCMTWKHSLLADQYFYVTENYLFGLLVFSLAYIFRQRFKANWVLDWMANISYPFYIIHSLTGYVTLKILLDQHISYELALLISFTVVCCLGFLIHKLVEEPTTNFGKNLKWSN